MKIQQNADPATAARWNAVTCWNCGQQGHTATLCAAEANPTAVAISKAAWQRRRERLAGGYQQQYGQQRGQAHGNYGVPSSVTRSPFSTTGADSGVFSTVYPPRNEGTPTIEFSDWDRDPLPTEAVELGTRLPGVIGTTVLRCGARLTFRTNKDMLTAAEQTGTILFLGKPGTVTTYPGPAQETDVPRVMDPHPKPTAGPQAATPRNPLQQQLPHPPDSAPPHAAIANLNQRMDNNDKRMDRLESKIDKTDENIGDIKKLLLGMTKQKTPSKRRAATQGRGDEDDDSDAMSEGDNDGPVEGTYALAPTPEMLTALGERTMDKPTKGVTYYGVCGKPGEWKTSSVTLSKTRQPDVSAPRECYATWHDTNSSKGWCSQLWIFSTLAEATEAAQRLEATCRPITEA